MARAASNYAAEHQRSMQDPSSFWLEQAAKLRWSQPPSVGLSTQDAASGRFQWFEDGAINATRHCVDDHAEAFPDRPALIYESAVSGPSRSISYAELRAEVDALAATLLGMGIAKGDAVVIYMPMVPETAFAMLACAKIGAVASVVFGGFAPHELAVRLQDCRPRAVLAASCGVEGPGRVVPYGPLLDRAIELSDHKPRDVLVLQRPEQPADLVAGRDHDWAKATESHAGTAVAPVEVPSTHPLYYLYTSGSTGTPKGVVRGTGDYLTALSYSIEAVYGRKPGDVWWAASDFGWVVGHSFILWGPLSRGMTSVIFEGKPVGTPDAGEYWRVIREHDVSCFFTAPTALRAIRRDDPEGELLRREAALAGGSLPLEALFLAGERSDPDTIEWAERMLGIPVIDHYWQTESGWPIVASCSGLGGPEPRAGSSGMAVPGWDVRVLKPSHDEDEDAARPQPAPHAPGASSTHRPGAAAAAGAARGKPVAGSLESASPHPLLPEAEDGELGPLAFRLPLPPGALTGLLNGDDRMNEGYLREFPGYFAAGDASVRDADGYIHILARTDDVLNVAGHRLSTGALEAAVATVESVAECAVIGAADAIKGRVPVALVVLRSGRGADGVAEQVVAAVRAEVGAVASLRSGQVVVVDRLPKTRSGKVLRATMRAIADGASYRVPATIDDPATLGEIATALQGIGYATEDLRPADTQP